MRRRVTTWRRQILAVIAGTSAGAALTCIPIMQHVCECGAFQSPPLELVGYVKNAFLAAALMWFVGIVVLGVPVWLVLQYRRMDTLHAALVSGFVLPLVPALVYLAYLAWRFRGRSGLEGIAEIAIGLGVLGLVSAVVSAIIWRVGYRWTEDRVAILQSFD